MRFWIPLLFLALVLRLGAAVYWQERICGENPFYFGDSETYWELAQAIAEGKPYEFSEYRWQIFRTPGYPVLLAPLFVLFGENPPVYAARILGAFLGTATVAAVGWLSFLLLNNRNAARFAAVIIACDPCQVLTSVFVLSEAPFCLLMVLQLAFWIKGRLGVRASRPLSFSIAGETPANPGAGETPALQFILCGFLYAAAVYCRPSWLYFVPFAMLFDVFAERHSKRLLVEYGTIFLVFAVAMTPWWVRNYRITDRFVATSLQMGPSLYDGLNPNADGGSQMDFVDRFREEERADPSGDPDQDIYEYRVDERMKHAAMQWAWRNPGRTVELAGIKFVRFWNFWPNEPSFSSLPVRLLIVITYVPVLIGAIGGIGVTWKRGFPFWLCWIPAVYFTALHLIFVSSLRYRVPAMLLLAILAGIFFTWECKNSFFTLFTKKITPQP